MPVNTLLQAPYMRHWHVAIDGIAEYGQQQGRMSSANCRRKDLRSRSWEGLPEAKRLQGVWPTQTSARVQG